MAAPDNVKDALDRLAAQVDYLTQIVIGVTPDFFLFEEWQQDPPQLPPAEWLPVEFIPDSSSTMEWEEPFDVPEVDYTGGLPPLWFFEKPEVIRSQATADVTTI